MKRILLFALATIALNGLNAQQDPMFTKYMFNGLIYNPAYAGSQECLSINLLHRHQWVGIEGAPITQTLTIHSPLKNERIALGAGMFYDQIGPTKQFRFMGTFAYRIPLGADAKLTFGLQGGFSNFRADFSSLSIRNAQGVDNAFYGSNGAVLNTNYLLPNVGAGVYAQGRKWFVGLSAPQLFNNDLRREGNITGLNVTAQQYRHYFVSGGLAIPLNRSESIVFRPVVMWKNVGMFMETNTVDKKVTSPNEIDIDVSFLFNKQFWIGAAFRTAVEGTSSWDSADIWAQFIMKNGTRIGVAYDYALTPLQAPSGGSYELMLGHNFYYNVEKILTPRYF